MRYLFSEGELDTPDRTVTPRRVRAKQKPQNLVANHQSLIGGDAGQRVQGRLQPAADERRRVRRAPATTRSASRSRARSTSSSIDARGTTGIARSGLLIRATSASSTTGSTLQAALAVVQRRDHVTRGAHTLKVGGEYRRIESDFQFLGSTEITYNSVNDFIDNRPNARAVALDSPVFNAAAVLPDRVRAGLLARRPTG